MRVGSGTSVGGMGFAKLSADRDAANSFVTSFPKFVQKNYSTDQCDETGFNFCLLPEKTLSDSFHKSADGRKKSFL